jgi:hypothetical protein
MQYGELFDVTVSDALRLLTGTQKTNSTHQYSRIIRMCSGADAQGASGADAVALIGRVHLVRGASRGRWIVSWGCL